MKVLRNAICLSLVIFCSTSAFAEVRVFACEPEWASLTEEIGGEDVVVFSATHGRQDPHYIRAKPSLIAQIRRADLLFCSGAELEVGWLPVLLTRGASRDIQPGTTGHLLASNHVPILGKPTIIDRSLGDAHPSGNPHVHLNPENILPIARELTNRLVIIDSDNRENYLSRLKSFEDRWSAALVSWNERVAELADMNVISHHASFIYLLDWANIERVGTLERVPGVPPTVAHLKNLLELQASDSVDLILRAPYDGKDASDWFSARADVPAIELPYTVGGHPSVTDLFSLFDVTLKMLKERRNRS